MEQQPVDLIIAVDDKLDDSDAWNMDPKQKRDRLRGLFIDTLNDVTGLRVPISNARVQLKLNTVLRSIGHEAFELADEAEVDIFADYKLPPEVLDTLYADIRAIMDYECIKRITFSVKNQIELLEGRRDKSTQRWISGATALMRNTSFLPVGFVTDLVPKYYTTRTSYRDRKEAMEAFGDDVELFGSFVTETICGPKDIPLFKPSFWDARAPITPAVRPIGLNGNEANDINAFDVAKAIEVGSRGLIIGSPIMGAKMGRRAATQLVIAQMDEYLNFDWAAACET